uniref:50S ribosomal protein L24, chloroplastic n=1 Tax=Mallomonas splendens TaxID=52552 RepID=A0A3G2R041_9STRA|nr:ribosomal protein L24 [Mallomonas splendens]AYO28572.1 ribosomal protein L24 [Mallomonas splendens]
MKKKQKNHIKKGDKIKVISGNQKGTIGNISFLNTKKSIVYIDTIVPRLKVLKKTKEKEGKQIELQIPIHVSNVMLWDKDLNQSGRIGYKILNQKKRRYFKKSGNYL